MNRSEEQVTSADQERQQAHAYIDRLPTPQLSVLRTLLASIVETCHAPAEDEDISDGEERPVAEAAEWLRHTRPIRLEEVLADLGLAREDFERMGQTPVAK